MSSDAEPFLFNFDGIDTIGLATADQEEVNRLYNLTKNFIAIYSSILLVFGIPGNIITLIVLNGYPMKDRFMSSLLTIEGIANTTDLFVNLGIYWVKGVFRYDVTKYFDVCTVYLIFFFTNHNVVVWMETLTTAARYYYLAWPDTALKKCTREKAWKLSGWVVVIALLFNVGIVMIETTVPQDSEKVRECRAENEYLAITHSCFLFYLPLLTQTYLNWQIYLCYKRTIRGSTESAIEKKNAGWQVFLVSVVHTLQFVVTVGPYAVYFHGMYQWFGTTGVEKAQMKLGYTICLMGVYTNYAINFFVYYTFGKRFRKGCRKLRIQCWNSCMRCLRRNNEQVEDASSCPSHTGTVDEEGIIKNRQHDQAIREDFKAGRLSYGMTAVWSQDRRARLSNIAKGQEQTQMDNIIKDVKDYRHQRLKQYQQEGTERSSGEFSPFKNERSKSIFPTLAKQVFSDWDKKSDWANNPDDFSMSQEKRMPKRSNFGFQLNRVTASIMSFATRQSSVAKSSKGSGKSGSTKSKDTKSTNIW